MHPVFQNVSHKRGNIWYVASAALVGFWESTEDIFICIFMCVCMCVMCLKLNGQSVDSCCSSLRLHKTSHVASTSCQTAYITQPAWSAQMSAFLLTGPARLAYSLCLFFSFFGRGAVGALETQSCFLLLIKTVQTVYWLNTLTSTLLSHYETWLAAPTDECLSDEHCIQLILTVTLFDK